MEFTLKLGSGHNNHAYTAVDANGHAIATVFKVGPVNQDADAGKGAYRIRLSIAGALNGKKVLVGSHDEIKGTICELMTQ